MVDVRRNTLYFRYLAFPKTLLACCVVALALAGYYATFFRFDASSENLVVEGDPDLAVYELVAAQFGGDDFLFLSFAPRNGQGISESGLKDLEDLVAAVNAVEGVRGSFSVLDAPLLKSPPVPLEELADGLKTLRATDVDLASAESELRESPLFKELLITATGNATAIRVDLERDQALAGIAAERNALKARGERTGERWESINAEHRVAREAFLARRAAIIAAIREVQTDFSDRGTLHLGGVPMIAADMITYVKRDLGVFSGTVIALMVAALGFFFRRTRWVVLPIGTAVLSVAITVGLLGFLDWQATVISSNFVSLLGITTISLTIHLIVQYREFLLTRPELDRDAIVFETMRAKFAPCVFTALTTIAAFGSLTVSGIVPVEDFGWMMCLGILISVVVTFTFFPAVLLLLAKGEGGSTVGNTNNFIRALGEAARWRPGTVIGVGVLVLIAAYFGINRVSLDNRFAEYFDTDTQIFQGMSYIDSNLGGTIPFDVVLSFPPYEAIEEEDDFFFEDEEEDAYPARYWFNRGMLDSVEAMHAYLESQPQVGKVLSLASLEALARQFTGGEKLNNLQIHGVLGLIPDDLRSELIRPYASPETGQLRLSGRIVEGGPAFDREEFRLAIKEHGAELGFAEESVVVTGMMVLFNSMLQQLLNSQVNTLLYIVLAVFVMFLVLLRSLTHALLGLIPNALAAATVIAAMGYAAIPLDMMTTTIAAVCIGIGVDNSIHYLHRFREEYRERGDARIAVSFCHASTGRALFFTTLTVVIGFSVLAFSNFVPTVMFGVWTAVAMSLALLANLTLLPALLVVTHASRSPDPEVRSAEVEEEPS